jgi:hypothetical protein
MTNPSPTLMKICASCGLEKPLSAFLQFSGADQGTYGNICGTCRRAEDEKAHTKKTEAGGGTSTETSKGIRSKDKVHSDIEKKQQHQDTEEQFHEERDEKEQQSREKTERKITKTETEKATREGIKKPSFLNIQRKPITPNTHEDKSPEAVALREQQTDASSYTDTRVAGKISLTQNVFRQAFLTQNRGVSPLALNSLNQEKIAKGKDKAKKEAVIDPLIELAEKTWGPSRKR